MRRRWSMAGLTGLALLLAGCAGGKTTLSGNAPLQITVSSSTVRAEESLLFTASQHGTIVSSVAWSVNGIPGGNTTVGLINQQGRYLAPAILPRANVVTISAQKAGERSSAALTLWNPIPVVANIQPDFRGEDVALTITGNKFLAGARVNVGGTVYPASVNSRTQLKVTVPAAAVARAGVEIAVANPEPGAAFSESTPFSLNRPTRPSRSSSSSAAARLLDQATFGPTTSDIASINQLRSNLGSMPQAMSQWIDDQMNPAVTVPSGWPDPNPIPSLNGNNTNFLCGSTMACVQIIWFQNALQGPDQLRQRTAFALSQIWVVSGGTVTASDSYVTYYKVFNDRAFGNYRDIMEDITLSSAMGFYLDMGNSAKPANGSIANENYARELLQLFTLGTYLLNDDGTFQLDGNGERIATYSEADVQAFARAFTGWTYKRNDNQVIWNQSFTRGETDRKGAMVFSTANHDVSSKTLLNYAGAVSSTLTAAQSPAADVDGALDNIFYHPNLPPFICQQLIQHLVTSNPSPAYVARVVGVFKNNGNGVRGDLAAVVKAILLDPEARQSDMYPANDTSGHLREPVLYITATLRSLGYAKVNEQTYTNNSLSNPVTLTNFAATLPNRGSTIGQNVLFSPSVFNYFRPEFGILGGTLLGPEFQLQTTANAPVRINYADSVSRNAAGSPIDVSGSLTSFTNLAANPQVLVDQLDQQFMYGQMSPSMKQTIINTITPMSNTFRARVALYLVISSSQYQVIR